MRQAAKITSAAHVRLMQTCHPGMHEYELEAEFIHECATRGARFQAYPSIVGGGGNACVLHYVDNRDEVKDGDLVLVDAGCEYGYYASDITRTFPVNGRFDPAQRAIYELALAAQEAAIAKVKPGNHWNDPHDAAVRVITKGLVDIGLLKGDLDPPDQGAGVHAKFYMHRTGHWLGMDVHDVGDYKVDGAWRELEPGMTLTVEPGLYIPAGDARRAEEVLEHRNPHRGRRAGHGRRPRGPYPRRAQGRRGDRGADGAAVMGNGRCFWCAVRTLRRRHGISVGCAPRTVRPGT